jgi:hypothetical protein
MKVNSVFIFAIPSCGINCCLLSANTILPPTTLGTCIKYNLLGWGCSSVVVSAHFLSGQGSNPHMSKQNQHKYWGWVMAPNLCKALGSSSRTKGKKCNMYHFMTCSKDELEFCSDSDNVRCEVRGSRLVFTGTFVYCLKPPPPHSSAFIPSQAQFLPTFKGKYCFLVKCDFKIIRNSSSHTQICYHFNRNSLF